MPETIAGLAAELGVHQMRVRQWLRRHRPRPESQKWMRYELSEADWFWEGNVQIRIADYLRGTGWLIEHTADTASGERGDDIRARRGADVLRVEVKGWPSEDYANPSRAREKKRTRPSTQAGHWYGHALLRAIRDLGRHPDDLAAIGLPNWPRFRRLLDDTRAPLARLGVGVYFVATDRSVDGAMAPRHSESVG